MQQSISCLLDCTHRGCNGTLQEQHAVSHIVVQGDEDEVVPPNQAQIMFDALKTRGVTTALAMFAAEQHGFRQATNIRWGSCCIGWRFYAALIEVSPGSPAPEKPCASAGALLMESCTSIRRPSNSTTACQAILSPSTWSTCLPEYYRMRLAFLLNSST